MSGPTEDYRGAYDEATLWMALSSIDPLWTMDHVRALRAWLCSSPADGTLDLALSLTNEIVVVVAESDELESGTFKSSTPVFREGRLITTDPIILAQLRAHWG